MKIKNETIGLADPNGHIACVIGRLPDNNVSEVNTEDNDIFKSIIKDKIFIGETWSDHDTSLLAIWNSFTGIQQEVISSVIQRYKDEIFNLECSLYERNFD
ncbi:hypothetical protein [Proteus sp. NMG38-2]|uniref:hypothetical protein n=1 Tax=Proteus sp. NMG38-2 TaxID=2883107 RepID=UPI001D0A3614|nr:hypothetical protein [Proteus sp. NMG38-2]UDN37532.1 hypothetical protein LG402_07770 [Proteus sp. NMG38-2]